MSNGMSKPSRCISLALWTHLVQRGRYEAGEPDGVSAFLPGGLKDLPGRHHYAEVYDLEVVALQYDPDDVLPDVVYIALDSGHNDRAVRLAGLAPVVLLDERDEVGNGLLHHAGALLRPAAGTSCLS